MFAPSLWDGFDEKTDGGRSPFLFESILPLAAGFSDAQAVEDAFHALHDAALRERVDCRIRVYDGEERRDDLIDAALDQAPRPQENLTGFMQRLVGKPRFSLVINNLEQASTRLAADFGQLIQSFFAFKGIPLGGVEQAAFCGNYSGTAFGIHEGFEHAFLCHLGPGVKAFYCWTREQYLAQAGTRAPTFAGDPAYAALMETGTLHVLKPGDVLYLPAAVYHIGRQDQYSISVALPFYTYPLKRFLSHKVIPDLSRQSLPFDPEGMSPLQAFGTGNPLLAPVSELLESTLRSWSDSELPHYLSYYWHRLRSNGGWELPRVISENVRVETALPEALPIALGTRVSLRQPYLISHQAGLDCTPAQHRVFIGARSVVLADPDNRLEGWIEQLNRRQTLIVESPEQLSTLRDMSRTGGLHCA